MDEAQRRAVGQQIRSARRSRGWSQKDLSTAAGVAPNTVGSIERGVSAQPGKLAAVLTALDIEPVNGPGAREDYPVDVELIRDAIGMWLVRLPSEERADAVRKLLEVITSR